MNVYLVRHGEREDGLTNVHWRLEDANPGLTPVGVEQAHLTGRRLSERGVDHVFASPFHRTVETAAEIAAALGVQTRVEDGLSEVLLPTMYDAHPLLALPGTASSAPPRHRQQRQRQRRWKEEGLLPYVDCAYVSATEMPAFPETEVHAARRCARAFEAVVRVAAAAESAAAAAGRGAGHASGPIGSGGVLNIAIVTHAYVVESIAKHLFRLGGGGRSRTAAAADAAAASALFDSCASQRSFVASSTVAPCSIARFSASSWPLAAGQGWDAVSLGDVSHLRGGFAPPLRVPSAASLARSASLAGGAAVGATPQPSECKRHLRARRGATAAAARGGGGGGSSGLPLRAGRCPPDEAVRLSQANVRRLAAALRDASGAHRALLRRQARAAAARNAAGSPLCRAVAACPRVLRAVLSFLPTHAPERTFASTLCTRVFARGQGGRAAPSPDSSSSSVSTSSRGDAAVAAAAAAVVVGTHHRPGGVPAAGPPPNALNFTATTVFGCCTDDAGCCGSSRAGGPVAKCIGFDSTLSLGTPPRVPADGQQLLLLRSGGDGSSSSSPSAVSCAGGLAHIPPVSPLCLGGLLGSAARGRAHASPSSPPPTPTPPLPPRSTPPRSLWAREGSHASMIAHIVSSDNAEPAHEAGGSARRRFPAQTPPPASQAA